MTVVRRIASRFARVYERRVSPLPLAAFRIAFGAVSLLEVMNFWAFRRFLFDDAPGVERASWLVEPLLLVWMLALACVVAGLRTRAAALVNYAIAVPVVGVWAFGAGYEWHYDSGYLTGSLLMLFSPVGAALSVDRLLARRRAAAERRRIAPITVSAIHAGFLALAVGLMYWDSALWKATSRIHLNGLGFWAPASLPFNTFLDLGPLLGPEAVVRATGYGVLLFEVGFLALFAIPRIRGALVAAGIVFHVGIMAAFPIPLFSLQMVSFYLGIAPAGAYEWIGRRLRRPGAAAAVDAGGERPLGRTATASIERAPAPTWPRERALAGAFLSFWLVSAAVIALAAPFHRAYLPFSHETHTRLERIGDGYRALVYPWTGFAAHGVFMDRHFERYTRQMMLVQRRDGVDQPLPMTLADGTSGRFGWGRGWAHWIFRTAAPTLPRERREAGLRRWVDFWLSQGGDLARGEIVIRERPLEVSLDEWRPGLSARNRAAPWRDVGRVVGEPGRLQIQWLSRPTIAGAAGPSAPMDGRTSPAPR